MNAHNEQQDPESAVVKQNLTTQPAAAPGIDLADVSLAAQMLTWGREEGLTDGQIAEIDAHAPKLFALIEQADASPKSACHPDDAAVNAFAAAMKAKLADARAKGRGGWNGDEPGMQQRLSDMLRAHVEKGDPRDVANFCMFLHQRGERISVPAPMPRPMDTAPRDGTVVRLLVQFEEHLIEDTDEPAWTIGACNDDLVPDDERTGWQVAGWCWEHDHFTEGKGTPVGWLPMLDSPKGGSDPWRGLYAPERAPNRDEYGCFYHPDIPSWDDEREESIAPLLKAQGFDLQCVPGDFSDEAMEEGGERYWQEMREWNPEPEGDGWRLVAIYDTEDGPYSMFVKPLAQARDAEVQP